MNSAPATLSDLLGTLTGIPADLPTVFRTDGAEIGWGYHITELKLADIESVDCGGRRDRWTEAQLQLLDGQDGETLTAGKIAAILKRCLAAIPGLDAAPLSVEFAPRNRGLGRYQLGVPDLSGKRMVLPLVEARAQCKPAVELGCGGASSACCS